MEGAETTISFEPAVLKAYSRNEAYMTITVSGRGAGPIYWCESEVNVSPPLTLAPDADMLKAKTRIGIIKPSGAATKKLKIYTKATNVPSTYKVSVTTYLYGEDGAIAERGECTAEISAIDPKVQDKRGNR